MRDKIANSLGSPERFGYEWNSYSDILPEHKEQLVRWLGPVTLESFAGKTVLDVGCGMGRNSFWILKAGASSVTSVDIDDKSLQAARRNLSGQSNSQVLKCSAYELSTNSVGSFDRVICIGVLHHLSSPDEALKQMWSCLAPGGSLLLWCYGRTGNKLTLPIIRLLQWIGSRLPIRACHALSKVVARLSWPIFRYWPWKTEYYRNLRKLSFRNFESIVFDQMLPTIAHYWSREEIDSLVAPLNGVATISLVQGNSWSIQVKKIALANQN